jgi:hypothetical protein
MTYEEAIRSPHAQASLFIVSSCKSAGTLVKLLAVVTRITTEFNAQTLIGASEVVRQSHCPSARTPTTRCSTGRRPKSAKARSRGKCGTWQSNERYEGRMSAPLSMVSATRARGDVYLCIPGNRGRVQWASRRAREMQQRAAGELIDGYCFERRQPGRTLPQLPRFGMSVAQEHL